MTIPQSKYIMSLTNTNFEKIVTTSFKDPIFNNVWQREWIDHVLYSETHAETPWVKNARVYPKLPDGSFIWEKYKHASDHFPVMVEIVTA